MSSDNNAPIANIIENNTEVNEIIMPIRILRARVIGLVLMQDILSTGNHIFL